MTLIGRTESGVRAGQTHCRAKLTDADVEACRRLRAEGLTYAAIAEKLECSASHVKNICRNRRRVATVFYEERRH